MDRTIQQKLIKNKQQIKCFLGYSLRTMPSLIEKKLDEELNFAGNFIEPNFFYEVLNLEEASEFLRGEFIKVYDYKVEKIAIILYTIGSKLEFKIKEHSQNGEMVRGLILDKIGIVALDIIKDEILDKLKAETGLKPIHEAYPGDKDFPISAQNLIYQRFKTVNLVTINEFSQFKPIKSVAAAIVLGKKGDSFDRCKICNICKED